MLSGKDRQEVENRLKMLSGDIELAESIKSKISKPVVMQSKRAEPSSRCSTESRTPKSQLKQRLPS
jgi:hypothetical protein